MTIGSRKGLLTKNVKALNGTVASYKTSISELFDRIRDKESINNTVFLTLGNEQLPMFIEGSALFHSLITMFNDGANATARDSDGVRKSVEALQSECVNDKGETLPKLPDDVVQAIETASEALILADANMSSWAEYAEKISQALANRNQAPDSLHVVNQNVNHHKGSVSTNLFDLILLKLDGLSSRMNRLEEMSINRTQSLTDNKSDVGSKYANSFVNSSFDEDDCAYSQCNLSHHSEVHTLPVNVQPHNTSMAEKMMQPHVNIQQHANIQTQAMNTPMYNQCLLPPLKIQAFNGKRTMYEEFKAVFEITIGDNAYIQDRQKLLYLKSLLPNQDKATISRFPLSDRGYKLAWQYLEKKYGNTNDVVEELWLQLKNLTVTKDSLPANKDMWLEAQSIVTQLELLEPLQPRLVTDVILRHFSPGLCREIYLSFSENTTNSWTEFQDLVDRIIRKRETAERRDEIYGLMAKRKSQNTSFTNHDRSPSPNHISRQKGKICVYCGMANDHYSSECHSIPMEKRREYIISRGRCIRCTGRNHPADQCKWNKVCPICNEYHHRSLPCIHINERKCSSNNDKFRKTPQNGRSTDIQMNIIRCVEHRSKDCGRSGGKKTRNGNPSGSPIQCALPILYGKIAGKNEPIPILLDSGAQLSLIDTSLAEELGLPIERSSTLHVRGFKSEVTTAKSHVVNIELVGKNFSLSTEMNTMKDLFGTVRMTQPSINDRKFIHQQRLEQPHYCSDNDVRPLIIVGADILWYILDGLKVTHLPSGNCHLTTKLGSVITEALKGPILPSGVGLYHISVTEEHVRSDTESNKDKKSHVASRSSGRVCYADHVVSSPNGNLATAQISQTKSNNREINQGKYHSATRSKKSNPPQKILSEKTPVSRMDVAAPTKQHSPPPNQIHRTNNLQTQSDRSNRPKRKGRLRDDDDHQR